MFRNDLPNEDELLKMIEVAKNSFKMLGVEDYTFSPKEDKTIYHFTKLDTAKKILSSATLRFSNPTKLNDSRDMDICIYDLNVDRSSYLKYLQNTHPNMPPDVLEFLLKQFDADPDTLKEQVIQRSESYKENLGVLCFSETYENPLMWSHYAEEEKGICLGVRTSAVSSSSIVAGVRYAEELLKANYFDLTIDASLFWAFQKSSHWAYEKEIRAFSHDVQSTCDSNRCIPLKIDLVEEIYFGVRTSREDIQEVISLLKEKGYPKTIGIFQMVNNPNNYGYLEPKQLTF